MTFDSNELRQNAFHFEGDVYNKYRPTYPPELFSEIIKYAEHNFDKPRGVCVDAACGNGQAAKELVQFYDTVIGIDPSKSQLENAYQHERITYKLGTAENTGLKENSVDLVVCAEALHWLDIENFYKECDRILKPGGVLACWVYYKNSFNSKHSPKAEKLLDELEKKLEKYWSWRIIKYVWNYYSNIEFPYKESLKKVVVTDKTKRKLRDYVRYISTWSGARVLYKENPKSTVIEDYAADLLKALELESLDSEIEIITPITLFMTRKPKQ